MKVVVILAVMAVASFAQSISIDVADLSRRIARETLAEARKLGKTEKVEIVGVKGSVGGNFYGIALKVDDKNCAMKVTDLPTGVTFWPDPPKYECILCC